MKILLHICCAPCTIYPLEILRKEASQVKGVFFNPNIHPYLEYKKRLDTVHEYAAREGLEFAVAEGYPIEDFLQKTAVLGKDRCSYCYEVRLRHTAAEARKGLFDAFTTTLLYSRYQKHDLIRATARDNRPGNENPILLQGLQGRVGGRGSDIQRDGNVPAEVLRMYI